MREKVLAIFWAFFALWSITSAASTESFIATLDFAKTSVEPCSKGSTQCTISVLEHRRGGFSRHVQLVWITVSPSEARLIIEPVRGDYTSRVLKNGSVAGDLVVASGSFTKLGSICEPEGLEIVAGKIKAMVSQEVNPRLRRPTGGFLIKLKHGEHLLLRYSDAMLRFEQFAQATSVEYALQSPVLLVMDGKIDEPLTNRLRADRLAIGIDEDGSIVVAGAFSSWNALTVREFAEFLVTPKTKGGPQLRSALHLEGQPAGIFLPQTNRYFGADGVPDLCVPNIIRLTGNKKP